MGLVPEYIYKILVLCTETIKMLLTLKKYWMFLRQKQVNQIAQIK